MLIGEPPRTPYDLNFSLFGFPVRVHPLFWLVAAILGASAKDINFLLMWVVVMFISILIHEFGHAFAMRWYGESARVVLYAMGGLAIADGNVWGSQAGRSRGSAQQIMISAAGPIAGFLFAGLTMLVATAMGIEISFVRPQGGLQFWELGRSDTPTTFVVENEQMVMSLTSIILFINIFWGVLNLMPIYPLDGGQISREIFVQFDAWGGLRKSLILSIVIAGCIAVYGLTRNSIFMALMFGMLAFSNWQVLQQIDGRGGGFGGGRPW